MSVLTKEDGALVLFNSGPRLHCLPVSFAMLIENPSRQLFHRHRSLNRIFFYSPLRNHESSYPRSSLQTSVFDVFNPHTVLWKHKTGSDLVNVQIILWHLCRRNLVHSLWSSVFLLVGAHPLMRIIDAPHWEASVILRVFTNCTYITG